MKRHINVVWLVLVACIMGLLVAFPGWLSKESIVSFISQLGPMSLLGYLLVSLFRALLLFPSTPFILAGAILFPQLPFLVLTISVIGVVVGAYLVYSFPSFGAYDQILEGKYPEKIGLLKQKMQSRYAFWFVVGWSFFPLVPTDVVCYVAGLAKMPFRKMITALLIGELPLVTIYVFVGAELGEWLLL